MKNLLSALALVAVCLSVTPASAQQTCSKLAAECVAWNKARGHDTQRCYGYKASCMQSGTWVDRNRQFSNVTKK
jgi:hypothetical protein